MGGSGSGRRWHLGAKSTTDQYRALDVRRLKSEGVLVPGNSVLWCWDKGTNFEATIRVHVLESAIALTYRSRRSADDQWQDQSQLVKLDRTRCHLGGTRPWFICPALTCGRRVAILYGGPDLFLCRHCLQFVYSSQKEDRCDRLARRVNKIRYKLGWEQGVLNNPTRQKPKNMHWKTFQSISAHHDMLLDKSLRSILAKMPLASEEDWLD